MSSSNSAADSKLRRILTDRLGTAGLRSLQVLLVLALASVVVLALVQLKLVVIPVLIALIIASAFSPVIGWLRRHSVGPMLATWITLITSLVVFGGVITLIVFAVRDQWSSLADSAVQGIEQLQEFAQNGPIPVDQGQIDELVDTVTGFLTSAQFGSSAVAGISAAGEIVTGAVLLVVVLFFFLKDGDRIWAFLITPLRGERHRRGVEIGETTVRTFGGYIRGTAIVALVDSVFIGIGLWVLGVPLALPLAVIVFIAAFIPIVGATLAGTLAALVALVANDPINAVWVVVVVIAVNQIEGNFLQPVVMGQSLKLHPLVILLALTAGTILGGIIGAILSVPIAAAAWQITRILARPTPEQPAVAPRRRRWFGA